MDLDAVSATEELSDITAFGDGIQKDMRKHADAVAPYRATIVSHGRPAVSDKVDDMLRSEQDAVRDELETIRAARNVESANAQSPVMVAQCNAHELAKFFSLFGETAVDPATATLPASFATTMLGSVMCTPGVARVHGTQADTPEAEQQRLRGVAQLIASARHVSQAQLESLSTCIDSVTRAGVWRVTNPEQLRASQLASQMLIPLPNGRSCRNGQRCIALTELEPHAGIGRMPLKAMQRDAAWTTFLSTGTWISEGELGKSIDLCVPCTLAQYRIAARARQESGIPCADIRFPFGVTTSCPGGFAPTHLLADATMPVAWPDVNAHDFVSVQRDVEYVFVDPLTRRTERRREKVWGYEFRAQVLFDEAQYSCGADEHPMIPPRSPMTVTTKAAVHTELPAALSVDVRTRLAADLPHIPNVDDAMQRMLVEFEATVRTCMSADQDTAAFLQARFSAFWQTAMMRIPHHVMDALGDINTWSLPTHAIATAMMWRTGLCYTLENTQLNGNSNLSAFLDAHTALQVFVLRQWADLKHPPSDRELVGDTVALITVESACAALRIKQVYPVYTVPHLSPKQHHDVRVIHTHRRRTPAMDIVRKHTLPDEFVGDTQGATTRQQCRRALRWLCEHDEAVQSGGGGERFENAPTADAPDSLASLLSSCAPGFQLWVAQAVSLVALQSDFDDSVWLLTTITERWPWFPRAAAAHTRSAQLPLSADPVAAAALNAGRWTPHGRRLCRERDMRNPARPAGLPANVPAWVRSVSGHRRFTAEYQHAADGRDDDGDGDRSVSVSVGEHLFPDSLMNIHGAGVHDGRYMVLGALRCRVYELQTMCKEEDRRLATAFDARLAALRTTAAAEAHNPRPHPDRHIVASIRDALGQEPDDEADDGAADADFIREQSEPLTPGASAIDAAKKLTATWPHSMDAVMQEAVDANVQLTESVGVELLRPLFGTETEPPPLYADGEHGPPVMGPDVDTAQAYARRCALFEALELAYHADLASDASDVHWHAIPDGSPLSHLHQHKPLANGAPCEDSLPDLSQYIGLNSLREAGAPSFLVDARNRHSWVTQVATVTYKACFMRDWQESHGKNCTHSEYAAWAAQVLMVTALGTYRHACRTLPFARAVEMYGHLRVQNSETVEGRRQLAQFLKRNTYMVMVAGQEFQMMTVAGSRAESRVMRAAWPSFAYVQECWVPNRSERLRAVLARGDRSLESKEAYAAKMVRGVSSTPEPRVFRHMPNTWPLSMLELFSRVEIDRQTDAVVNSGQATVSLLPRFVNTVPPETKHLMVSIFSRTDPQEAIRLAWFAQCGVSATGLAQLAMANAVYTVQGDSRVITYLVERMSHADFFFAWTAMHIMVLHRDTMVMPMPWHIATRQYASVQYRVGDMHEPPPSSFTHMTFCHLLGCPGPQSYTVPMADGEHYGADATALAIDIGQQTCRRNCTDEMFDRLVRRSKESPVQNGLDQLNTLRTTLANSTDADERTSIQMDITRLHEKLVTQQAKNVRATAAVAFNRPCNEVQSRRLQIVGAMVVQRNSVHARSVARVYTACPVCGVPTIYSMDRYGANGFTCGKCIIEERWSLHGNWCISCGMVEQGTSLPELTGEAQAAARAARTQHHICGSTSQPRSLRSGASRRRHSELLRRQELADKAHADASAGKARDIDGNDIDTSDTLATPAPSVVTQAVADRQAAKKGSRRVKKRRQNIAATYELGRNRTNVHPCSIRMRMDPFTAMPLIDDRPGGLNTTAVFSLCGPCLTRVRFPTVSLSNLLAQSQAEPEEIWVNGRRIAVGGKLGAAPRMRRRFFRRSAPSAGSRGQPAAKRKIAPSGKTVMLKLSEAPAIPYDPTSK